MDSHDPPSPARARAAFLRACRLDVETMKPGNVSVDSAGHGMTAAQFIASADAAASALFTHGATVGARILDAVSRTRDVAGCNTNLGIVLLIAPLAAALDLLADSPADDVAWRTATQSVLAALDLDDARAAYRAIALANPGGLGDAPEQSVHELPTVDLRAAMALAADRDSVARQYANGFRDVFETGLDTARRVQRPGQSQPATVVTLDVFLAFLSGWPDSHIVRKHGLPVAQSVTREARSRYEAMHRALARDTLADELLTLGAWDAELKVQGINPGTSADLTVATLFVAGVVDGI
ncbi:triphosphoribosyl-dephospho-CoA synthase [Caballeronia mineralivorans]|uniref:triphosphoribosyl-dephospho-CoA synthase n=1 Tax=Caballeronia mineralivorans TaxID=2010198 RepID=UPI0023EF6637|nr:triphosphoribosyl-dephospho-CoA synthase [Caballeronia mineralivorans]